jgi:hypothetical protein
MSPMIVRAGGPFDPQKDFGLLAKLPGRWVGQGFNLIARPNLQGKPKGPANPVFFLELNAPQRLWSSRRLAGTYPIAALLKSQPNCTPSITSSPSRTSSR